MAKMLSYKMPLNVGSDPAANLAFFLMENASGIWGKWSGPLKAADQRALFGRFLGKGRVYIDGAEERLKHIVTVGFGMDFDVTADVSWRDLTPSKDN
jgi:hypothetical protein